MSPGQMIKSAFAVIAVIIVLAAAWGSAYTVNETERAVVLKNGKMIDVAQPGLNWKIPFITDTKMVPLITYTQRYEKVEGYSKDQQAATLRVSVTYAVPAGKVAEFYQQYRGDIEGLNTKSINPIVPQSVENVFGQYTALSAVQDRVRLVSDVTAAVKNSLKGIPVVIESVQLENIQFSEKYEKSIEDRMEAEILVTKRQQDAQANKIDAEMKVTTAQGEASSQLAIATAKATATRLQGEADAAAIKAKSDAMNNANPNLVAFTIATTWNGILPNPQPGTVIPMLPLDKLTK